MDTLICAGGSGARVLESVLHLCAVGLGPPRLRTFVIDSDGTNGSLDRTTNLVGAYVACQKIFGKGPFFRTELDLLEGSQKLRVWSPVVGKQHFRDVLNYDGLSPQQREIVELLFTDDELKMPMDVGFRGHPALGAAALSLLPLFRNDPKDPLWNQVATDLQQDVTNGEAHVVIAGSVFGGTGASAIYPLVRFLRSPDLLAHNSEKLKIGAIALAPYFQFSAADAQARGAQVDPGQAARSEEFPLASRSAAEFYDYLLKHNDWGLNAMYWVGDDDPVDVAYSWGGSAQNNPAHFVELLSAVACLDFFRAPSIRGTFYYSGPRQFAAMPGKNMLTWADLPLSGLDRKEVRNAIHCFHLAGMAHLGFFSRLFPDSRLTDRPYLVPWYRDYFANRPGGLNSDAAKEAIKPLTDYFSNRYFPWWGQIQDDDGRVRLLNRTAWAEGGTGEGYVQLSQIGAVLFEDGTSPPKQDMDSFFDWTVKVAKNSPANAEPASRYVSILASAAARFVGARHGDRAEE